MVYSPDGRTLASAGWTDFTIRLWDVKTGRGRRILTEHQGSIRSVAYSPDGRTLASGSVDGTIRLWDVNTGRTLRTRSGHTDGVLSVAYSPDGRTLASGSSNGTIRLWDVNTGRTLRTLTGHTSDVPHTSDVLSVAYSPDGRTLASGSSNGTVLLWELNPPTTAVTQTAFRVIGGTTKDYTDSQGRLWRGAQQRKQKWGGWIEKRPLHTKVATLTANAQAQAQAAGYDAELFHAVSWARHPDTVQYQFKTGNGTFDVTYLVSEHWFPKNRGFDILIEGEVVEPLYVTPGRHEIGIKTYRGIEVTDGTLDIQLKGSSQSGVKNVNPMFSALEVVSSPLGAGDAAAPMSVALVPEATALLANYPNPFNPETWIPYQLADPADVTVHIYGIKGALVRTLSLGYQDAGMYASRGRAAYWDGKNAVGEPVASGVYFYTLTAGDFTATRKLLIRK